MTRNQLQKAIAKWAFILELDGWRITFDIVSVDKLSNAVAICYPRLTDKRAHIDFRDDALSRDDIEVTVVHELLHLHTAPVIAPLRKSMGDGWEDSLENVAEEQLVHHLSEAFVKLANDLRKIRTADNMRKAAHGKLK